MKLKFKGGPRDGMLLQHKEPAAPKTMACRVEAERARMLGEYVLVSIEGGIAHMLWKSTRRLR